MNRLHKLTSIVTCIAAAALPAASASPLEIEIDSREIDREQNLMPQSYAIMLESATPAVVSVHTARIVTVARGGRGLSPEEDLLRRFFGMPAPRQEQQPTPQEPQERLLPQGIGSGVIISSDGYVVTNSHVVTDRRGENADEVLVKLNDGRELEAEIVGTDVLTDIAILKIDAENLPAIRVADSDNIKVGDVVFAIGNPMEVGLTVTQGIVSATNRAIGIYGDKGYESFIQTDASINPGNSGGALIDANGRLIGINSAIISRSGGNIGIGFAIPTNLALSISQQLAESGEVKRGFLGVSIDDVDPDMAEAFGLPNTDGVLINGVEEGSAADKGGLERGDIIRSLDGKPVETANQFRIRIGNTIPGTEVKLGVLRDGEELEITTRVGEVSGRFAMGANELIDGVEVANLDDELAERYRVPDDLQGVVVTAVSPDSPYARSMIEGMVIQEINDTEIESISEAREHLRTGVNKLFVYNRGRTGYMALRVN